MACSSGCRTPGTHATYGACLRAKQLQIEGVEAHDYNRRVRSQQNEYAKARMAGLQPDGLGKTDVDEAYRLTEQIGVPYRADDLDGMIKAYDEKKGYEGE